MELRILFTIYVGDKFSKKELNVKLKVRSASKKRKRNGGKEVVAKITETSTMEKRMKPTPPPLAALPSPFQCWSLSSRLLRLAPGLRQEWATNSLKQGQLLNWRQNPRVTLPRRVRLTLRRWSLYPYRARQGFLWRERVGPRIKGVGWWCPDGLYWWAWRDRHNNDCLSNDGGRRSKATDGDGSILLLLEV